MASNPYDSRKLLLPANDIHDSFTTVSNQVNDMVNSINAINNALQNIPWDGQAQQDAEQVSDRWSKAITNLLGTSKDPTKGSMNIVLTSLDQASGNYATAEQQLKKAFAQMQTDITSTPSPGQPAPAVTSVLVTYENNDPNAVSTFVEEIYSTSASGVQGSGSWTTSLLP